jgi:hypothetical protein
MDLRFSGIKSKQKPIIVEDGRFPLSEPSIVPGLENNSQEKDAMYRREAPALSYNLVHGDLTSTSIETGAMFVLGRPLSAKYGRPSASMRVQALQLGGIMLTMTKS